MFLFLLYKECVEMNISCSILLLYGRLSSIMSVKKHLRILFLDSEIMVSDSFVLQGEEYLLLSLRENEEKKVILRLLGISAKNLGRVYSVEKRELEKHWKNPTSLKEFIHSHEITN